MKQFAPQEQRRPALPQYVLNPPRLIASAAASMTLRTVNNKFTHPAFFHRFSAFHLPTLHHHDPPPHVQVRFPLSTAISQVLGTPNEDVWPGVTLLQDWSLRFPLWPRKLLLVTFFGHPQSYTHTNSALSQVLGTPNEDVWPGVTLLQDWTPRFPLWPRELLSVTSFTHTQTITQKPTQVGPPFNFGCPRRCWGHPTKLCGPA